MRTISLVKRLKWNFSGNMNPHALVIGDVDNDNENEFVIGNLNGDLAIFKGECGDGYPSFVCRGLGTITCIAIGDVRNQGKNSVVVINAEGHAHIFDIPAKSKNTTDQHISVDDYLTGGRRSSDTASIQAFKRMMSSSGGAHSNSNEQQQSHSPKVTTSTIQDLGKPNLTLKVPVNVNKILIADIDNDDLNELILARTDRILHAFQLVPTENIPGDHLYKGVQTPSLSSISPSASSTNLNPLNQQPQSKKINLLDKNMWVFDGQISSLCTTTSPDKPNQPLLLVAQPGNTFTVIDQDGKRYNKDLSPQLQQQPNETTTPPKQSTKGYSEEEEKIRSLLNSQDEAPVHVEIFKDESATADHDFRRSNYVVKNWPLLDPTMTTSNMEENNESGAVATEIVIGKRHYLDGNDSEGHFEVGMLSMDGKFSIYDLKQKTTSQRDLFVTHKLFSLATLDVTMATNSNANTNNTTIHHKSNYSTTSSKSSLINNNNATHRYHSGVQTPISTATSQLRFSTTTPHDVSRTSSKLSLNGLLPNKDKKAYSAENSGYEEGTSDEEVINRNSPQSDTSSNSEIDEDDSDYESVPWSENDEEEDENQDPGCDLFVACAWNGVTYLVDWSKKTEDNKIKYQLVKFAFEGRVCAFTAGLFTVDESQVNVPCLFYVDFEDQIYVYYDVRISPGPVAGFIDTIDDDIEEALDRINSIDALSRPNKNKSDENAKSMDLGDGWHGIADNDDNEDDDEVVLSLDKEIEQFIQNDMNADPQNLADFIHECLYDFDEMKDRMENEVFELEQTKLSNRLPPGGDVRRLSDLNITIDPPAIDNEDEEQVDEESMSEANSLLIETVHGRRNSLLYPIDGNISEESSESYGNDTHIASWIEGSLIGSSIFDNNNKAEQGVDSSDDGDESS